MACSENQAGIIKGIAIMLAHTHPLLLEAAGENRQKRCYRNLSGSFPKVERF